MIQLFIICHTLWKLTWLFKWLKPKWVFKKQLNKPFLTFFNLHDLQQHILTELCLFIFVILDRIDVIFLRMLFCINELCSTFCLDSCRFETVFLTQHALACAQFVFQDIVACLKLRLITLCDWTLNVYLFCMPPG